MKNDTKITIRLPKIVRSNLSVIGYKTGKSKSEIVREALEMYYKMSDNCRTFVGHD